MAYNDKALKAIENFKKKASQKGSDIILVKEGGVDPNSYNVDTGYYDELPPTNIPLKAFPFDSASDETLSKLSGDDTSYSIVFKLYTDEPINENEYKIKFRDETKEIIHISEKIYQNTTIMYEVLLK